MPRRMMIQHLPLVLICVAWLRLWSCSLNSSALFLQVSEVKKIIETTQGQGVYPADQQMLIHQGKVLKDDTTLEINKVAENNLLLIVLSKVFDSMACCNAMDYAVL